MTTNGSRPRLAAPPSASFTTGFGGEGSQSSAPSRRRPSGGRCTLSEASDKVFTGSMADVYDTHLVPLIFEHYAADLADRTATLGPGLEIAAGSGWSLVRSRRCRNRGFATSRPT